MLPYVPTVHFSLHQVGYWYTKRVKRGEAYPYEQWIKKLLDVNIFRHCTPSMGHAVAQLVQALL
jgi:hypothetical protein